MTNHRRSRAILGSLGQQPSVAEKVEEKVDHELGLDPGARFPSPALEDLMLSWRRPQQNGTCQKMTACQPSDSTACQILALFWEGLGDLDHLVPVRAVPLALPSASLMVPPIPSAIVTLLLDSFLPELPLTDDRRQGGLEYRDLRVPVESQREEPLPLLDLLVRVACCAFLPRDLVLRASADLRAQFSVVVVESHLTGPRTPTPSPPSCHLFLNLVTALVMQVAIPLAQAMDPLALLALVVDFPQDLGL